MTCTELLYMCCLELGKPSMAFHLCPSDVPRGDNDRCILSWHYLRTVTDRSPRPSKENSNLNHLVVLVG
jgi:hypothetical protein